jgi:hypothetical protein
MLGGFFNPTRLPVANTCWRHVNRHSYGLYRKWVDGR